MLVGVGATTTISIRLGQGKREEAEKLIGNAITLSSIIAIVLTMIRVIFGELILSKFGASESTMQYAKDYIYIILIGNIFNMVAFALNNTIRGDGNIKLAVTRLNYSRSL